MILHVYKQNLGKHGFTVKKQIKIDRSALDKQFEFNTVPNPIKIHGGMLKTLSNRYLLCVTV